MKKFFLPILALSTLVPAAAQAQEQRFEHEGRIYSYTVARTGDTRVISGVEEKTGKPFVLRVGEHRVRGTVGSQQVSFPLREVEPLAKVTILASR
ncbi:hypothetical protein L7H23_07265 [Sphingopyxis sp. BSN-002]|uniref:hypothetical protein n=1 Tax=Sphingopyxis sp. BSN-002 TaxID=2911495 RepID=UPI001EDAB68B|nr:hypothetical protein [Sphingopyxis sp. BSN-002]UKK85895.1 hypothetical protein L7H23_07265 [Sphingopyxis sp. BSN-002]